MEKRSTTLNWQPITRLAFIAEAIDGMLGAALEVYGSLVQARVKPWVMDKATIGHVLTVFAQQREDLWLYEEQFRRWESQALMPKQQQEVTRLFGRVEELREVLTEILDIAREFQTGSIERLLTKGEA